MIADEARKRCDLVRLIFDLPAAKVELLSAQCAVDRLRLHYSLWDIVTFGERRTLERAIASARALNQFFSEIEAGFPAEENEGRRYAGSSRSTRTFHAELKGIYLQGPERLKPPIAKS